MRLVIQTNNILNVNLANILDADLKITSLPNVQNHLKITRNNESKSVSVKGVIVHPKKNSETVITTMTKRYMHLWHKCLVMTKFLVDIPMTVRN